MTIEADGGTLGEVRAAYQQVVEAQDLLRAAVDRARVEGRTWQEIGDILGTTRQAAFQRFGRPIDPRTGAPMSESDLRDEVLTLLLAGHETSTNALSWAFYLLGDRDFLEDRAAALGLDIAIADVTPADAAAAFADALPVVATGHAATAKPGQPVGS